VVLGWAGGHVEIGESLADVFVGFPVELLTGSGAVGDRFAAVAFLWSCFQAICA